MSLILTEMDAGSWVIFELPGFTTAASGTPQESLDALRKATDTSYFKGKMRSGSSWSPTATVLVAPLAAALVVEPSSRSAGKKRPCCTKSPRRTPGAFFFVPRSAKSGARDHFNAIAHDDHALHGNRECAGESAAARLVVVDT
jgi:hypothetical protein